MMYNVHFKLCKVRKGLSWEGLAHYIIETNTRKIKNKNVK